MPEPKPSKKRLRTLCAEIDPDDGSDPRIFFRKDGDRKPGRHKARQLSRQVSEILDGLLAGSTADPVPERVEGRGGRTRPRCRDLARHPQPGHRR